MLSKEDFIDFILKGSAQQPPAAVQISVESSLPDGFEGFDPADLPRQSGAQSGSSFARKLLEASGFGYAELVQRDSVIRGSDAVARYLPGRVAFWPKTSSRPYQTLLFEADLDNKQLLAIPAFKSRKMAHLEIVEDALARLVSEALEGFQRGGEGVTADIRKGRKDETLCVISILDRREDENNPLRLVCFGTQSKTTGGLETFQIAEQTKSWDAQLAREYLGLLYQRQFKKLDTSDWQESFTTTEERRQADKLLAVCTRRSPQEDDIQESVLDLLDTIAKGFGLRKRPNTERRLQAFELPPDHEIGIDPEWDEGRSPAKNPFSGVTLRDERNRLLGYIIYPLKNTSDANKLREHLQKYNRFHNVLVVYPDEEHTSFELWQGQQKLNGKLRKGQGYKDAADVVNLLSRFFIVSKAMVRNPTELAQELAYRARYLRRLAVRQLDEESIGGQLRNLYNAFKSALVHDQTEAEFADAFAQTITYGLLTARWTGNAQLVQSGERFTRRTALKHLPSTSAFLNDLFTSALSVKLDEHRGRLLWLVDDIADLLDRIDVDYVFGVGDRNSDETTDPVIHFYEPFLAAYDKHLKNQRGVFFTPRAVVAFIVRSVDQELRDAFGLEDGLASRETWGDVAGRLSDIQIPPGVKSTDSFVRILDPAAGTGTFLYECIDVIENTMKERWRRELAVESWDYEEIRRRWVAYVRQYLIPRLVGYELMMAPYSVAHLKIALKLSETGFELRPNDRIQIYLTNSLEPPTDIQEALKGTAPALAQEAIAVNSLKRYGRFTVLLGNPPYSNFGQLNQNDFILGLLQDYKYGLQEKKLNLDDDFIKFMRFAHYLIQQSGSGICGFITNNAYLDGITHRRMRKELMDDFPSIRIVDLHGNVRKAESANGGVDENVFDIMQGVAIGLYCTQNVGKTSVQVADLRGSREWKYGALSGKNYGALNYEATVPSAQYYLFAAEHGESTEEYERGIPLSGLPDVDLKVFQLHWSPIQTKRDRFTIHFSNDELQRVLKDLKTMSAQEVSVKYSLKPDGRDWTVAGAIADVKNGAGRTIKIGYKPFDTRYTYYTGKTKGFLAYPRRDVMKYMLAESSRAFVFKRQAREDPSGYTYFFVSRYPFSEGLFAIDPRGREFLAPMMLAAADDGESDDQYSFNSVSDGHNFTRPFLCVLAERLALPQSPDTGLPEGITAAEIFHYLYAVVSSPTYRRRFERLLRIDFPRVPLTSNQALFHELARLGERLANLHVLEKGTQPPTRASWVGCEPFTVEKVSYQDQTVWIDKKQTLGCSGVPPEAWNYWIGGYQVCEKWLSQRKGHSLSGADRDHFESVVAALAESCRVLELIEAAIVASGGWQKSFTAPGKPGQ